MPSGWRGSALSPQRKGAPGISGGCQKLPLVEAASGGAAKYSGIFAAATLIVSTYISIISQLYQIRSMLNREFTLP
jgi:hypothetical protein